MGSESGGTEYDDFGFAVSSDEGVRSNLQAYSKWFQPKARRRLQRFEAKRDRLLTAGGWTQLPKAQLKALLRKGVPAEHRAEVWWSVLDCETRKGRAPDTYSVSLTGSLETRACEEIERDLARTFPEHRIFRTDDGKGQLRDVLRAFAQHLPRVRYCQGLNFIAAMLLIVFADAERAFWAMVCAMETLGVAGYYEDGMTLLRTDMRVLLDLLTQLCPKMAKCLKEHNIDLTCICSEWYITWFANCLPMQTVMRVWDTLFFEGFKVLFRVAVGVFKRVEADVLSDPSFEHIMQSAKQWPRRQVEHNALLKMSFKGMRRRRDLQKARDRELLIITAEEEARRQRAAEAAARSQAPKELQGRLTVAGTALSAADVAGPRVAASVPVLSVPPSLSEGADAEEPPEPSA